MGLEEIFLKISEEAKSEVENILNSASNEADKILEDVKKEAALLKDKILATSRIGAEFFFQKEVVAKRLSAQKEILKTKKFQLDSCFQEALEVLLNLDNDLYHNLIKNMLTKINLKEEGEVIFSNRDKSRISQDFIHRLNPRLKLLFSDHIKGGFILKTKELIMDNSLENILADLRLDFEPKVAEILFKKS